MNSLRQIRAGKRLPDRIAPDVGDLGQSFQQAKRLQNSGINPDPDIRVASFHALEG
jgi:hypothetical protein